MKVRHSSINHDDEGKEGRKAMCAKRRDVSEVSEEDG